MYCQSPFCLCPVQVPDQIDCPQCQDYKAKVHVHENACHCTQHTCSLPMLQRSDTLLLWAELILYFGLPNWLQTNMYIHTCIMLYGERAKIASEALEI